MRIHIRMNRIAMPLMRIAMPMNGSAIPLTRIQLRMNGSAIRMMRIYMRANGIAMRIIGITSPIAGEVHPADKNAEKAPKSHIKFNYASALFQFSGATALYS